MRNICRQIYFYDTSLKLYDQLKNDFMQNYRYLKKANGTYDFIKIDEVDSNCIKGKLINSDDTGLTYYEEQGDLKFLKDVITGNRKYIRSFTLHNFS